MKPQPPETPEPGPAVPDPADAGWTVAVLEASPNPIVAADRLGRITYLNEQAVKVFGYSRGELLGEPIEVLTPQGSAERHVRQRTGFVAAPQARPLGIGMDLAGRRKDGTEFPVEISLAPVETPHGPWVFTTIVDITARQSVESQLLQAQKLESIGRLAGAIAHDFNNVLFAITGYTELLAEDLAVDRREALDPDDALRSVRAISDAATRAAALTAQLLAFSRRQVVTPEVLELNAAIAAIEPMLRRLIGAHVRLVVRPTPGTGRLQADASQLDQIVVNLVVNARDAMPRGGTITIETGNVELDRAQALRHLDVESGSYVSLEVRDTGEGMDARTREHVFEPFFTTKEQGHGTGLGLSTIYGIVRQAGGHIWLESEPGVGTSFRLFFPRVDAQATAPRSRPAARSATGSGPGSGSIMIAEDETSVREMISAVLRRAGYDVTAVGDGPEALERLIGEGAPIDILVTDVVMPGMSGIDLAEHVLDHYPLAGVVLLSGYNAETLDLDRVVRRGALFLPKPITSAELVDAVKRSLERRVALGAAPD